MSPNRPTLTHACPHKLSHAPGRQPCLKLAKRTVLALVRLVKTAHFYNYLNGDGASSTRDDLRSGE
jgi:hypothetical protein